MSKRIAVLGSTGSVGRNVLDVVAHHPDHFDVVGLVACRNTGVLREQCATHRDAMFSVWDDEAHARLLDEDPELARRSRGGGDAGILGLIDHCEPDLVVNCLVGFVGLKPTLHAISRGIHVALANKEAVVTGGALITEACRRSGAELIPIDSEHVAISQCLRGSNTDDVRTV